MCQYQRHQQINVCLSSSTWEVLVNGVAGFFMIWVAACAAIGQVRPTFESIISSHTSQLTMPLSHTTYQHQWRHAKEAITHNKQLKGEIYRQEVLSWEIRQEVVEGNLHHYPLTFIGCQFTDGGQRILNRIVVIVLLLLYSYLHPT